MLPELPEQAVTALVFAGARISELLDADIDDRPRAAARRRRVNGRYPYTEITSRWSTGSHEEAVAGVLDAIPGPLRMRPDELGGPRN